jgi:MFS family permease
VGLLRSAFGADGDVIDDRNFRLLMAASLVSPLGTAVVSPILDSLTGVFGVGEARIGLLVAVFTAPSILLIPVVGVLSDRVGRRPVLAAGLALYGGAGLAVALVDEFRIVLLLRLLQGVGYCGVGPVLITAVGDLYEGAREATAQGVRFTTVGLALTGAPLAAGALVGLAWQYPFVLYGLGLPAAVAVWLGFDEPADRDGDGPADLRATGATLVEPRVVLTLVGRATPSFVWFAFLTYASIVVVRLLDGSAPVAGAVVAAASLGSSVGATQVGRLTAATDGRQGPTVAGVVATALGLGGLAVAPGILAAGLGAAVGGAGFGVALTLFRSEMTRLAPERSRGGLVSVGEAVGRIGSTAAPVVAGAAVAFARPTLGFGGAVRAALGGATALALIVGVACVLLAARLPAPADSPAARGAAEPAD